MSLAKRVSRKNSKKRYGEDIHIWKVIKKQLFYSTAHLNLCPRSFLLSTCTWPVLQFFPVDTFRDFSACILLSPAATCGIAIETTDHLLHLCFYVSR